MIFKLSNMNSNLTLTQGYLNPALNNSALDEKKKTSTKKSKQTKTKEDVERKSKIVFILFLFFLQCFTFLVKIILFYTRIKNICIFLPLLLRVDTRAQFTCSSKRIAEEPRDLNSLEKIQNDFLSL